MTVHHGDDASRPALSVVIPSYNSAQWLPSTLDALARAIEPIGAPVQVIVVDDGSTDETVSVVTAIAAGFPGSLEVASQANSGRFLARWAGLERARSEWTLLLDSRVLIDPTSLSYVLDGPATDREPRAWNGHVVTDASGPLVGLFWEVPTHVFWGGYLRRPRPMDIDVDNFDSVPKGTTMFLAETGLLRDAFRASWPEGDASLMSDDTKVLRWVVEQTPIRIDPAFSAVYRPRTVTRAFVSHSFLRGTLFVDSYAGTTVLRSVALLVLAAGPVLLVAAVVILACLGLVGAALAVVAAAILLALLPVVPAAINRCRPRSLLAYIVCLPIFVSPFWAGLVRGVAIHRRSLFAASDAVFTEHPPKEAR